MDLEIIQTGSKGNSTIIEKIIMIDCGLPFSKIDKFSNNIKVVLLTHIHRDHFNKSTIKKLARLRPTLRFACGDWMIKDLLECGVSKSKIDIVEVGKSYDYTLFKLEPVKAYHDVSNIGYKIYMDAGNLLYITDTSSIEHINAKGFDFYLIEGNYENEEELRARKLEKAKQGIYIYEDRVSKTHLSKEKAYNFFYENGGENSKLIIMHEHQD